ncbi:MAG TPA: membrane protein insertase YidC [Vicinamibacterales bacterium]|nr:membrane protein insertase YidC [Vicinamibacterales bacterium]
MERRVLLAVFLSFLVIYVYQALLPVPQPTRQPRREPARPGAAVQRPPAPPVLAQAPPPLVAAEREQDIVVETPAVRAVFTTRGGTLKSWRLKHYLDARGAPLELVPSVAGAAAPFSLRLEDDVLSARLATALFAPSAARLDVGNGPGRLVFDYRDAAGLFARKTFEVGIPGQPFLIRFTAEVSNGGRPLVPVVEFGPALGPGAVADSTRHVTPRAVFSRGGDVERRRPADLGERVVEEGVFDFAGVEDHYFLSTVVSPGSRIRVEYRPVPAEGGAPPFVAYAVRFAGAPVNERLFLGPKDFDVLVAVDRRLVRAIDFGVFAWLVVPLLRALKWINGYVGNYGWSIVILTILINLAMFPLRHKSVVSMRKLQAIQPEVKAIQDRYAKLKLTDPARQKMNVELMNLYRERGVNPASGCIPMLLTMPVLFAFYAMLSVAIELRGAPFIGWIRDLSAHDPLYITPILMGVSMVWQQKLTPMPSADPVQQRMMMLTPLIFTVFFLWAPSGLVIYWLVSNLWAIGQQVVTNRLIGPAAVHVARPPAERRVRRRG